MSNFNLGPGPLLDLEQASLAFKILALMEESFPEDEDIHKNIPVLEVLLNSMKSELEPSE